MRANLFNIQKFCLHDGPGIRSTVFFKGCNLRCRWCANPESQCLRQEFTLDREKCRLCGRCAEVCPAGARLIAPFPSVDAEKCVFCGKCAEVCPAGAIAWEGKGYSVDEVLEEVMKDNPFYDHSGGGVTFSGGEVLLQLDFALELARRLHENGVHVAVETAACVPQDRFARLLDAVDYVFVDLKHHDSARHREGTGLGNEMVIENIRLLRESGREFRIRIPVIPGYNDSDDDAAAFAHLLKEMGIEGVQLLPFHQFGQKKYALLGMDYAYDSAAQLHSDDLKQYMEIFAREGVHAEC